MLKEEASELPFTQPKTRRQFIDTRLRTVKSTFGNESQSP
jgi:recombinational DNA repair ATPase RecF